MGHPEDTTQFPTLDQQTDPCFFLHYLDAGIDTGPMLAHARPSIVHGDGPHDIGNKTIVAAAEVLLRAAAAHLAGTARPVSQWPGGRLYQRKNFSANAVRTGIAEPSGSSTRAYLLRMDIPGPIDA